MADRIELPKYRKHDGYLWSDFIELLCLWNTDKIYSRGDYIDRIKLTESDLEPPDRDQDDDDFTRSENLSERYEIEADDIFQYFNYRSMVYEEFYPFSLAEQENYLQVKEGLTDKQYLYIYLLFCSHLKYFRNEASNFTTDFELLSTKASAGLAPPNAILYNVGKNTAGDIETYKGNLFAKLEQMAKDLGESLRVTAADFASKDSGDGGIDLLGWVPFSDKLNSRVLYVGQSKCSLTWFSVERPDNKLTSFIDLNNKPNCLYFIPFCFRKPTGVWFETYRLSDKILIDRFRFIDLLSTELAFFATTNSYTIVKTLVEESEEVI